MKREGEGGEESFRFGGNGRAKVCCAWAFCKDKVQLCVCVCVFIGVSVKRKRAGPIGVSVKGHPHPIRLQGNSDNGEHCGTDQCLGIWLHRDADIVLALSCVLKK